MAKRETWKKLKYFKKKSTIDNWGDPDAIDDELLLRLDDFRNYIGVPIIVTHGVKTSGHTKGSYHYSKRNILGEQVGACAVDIVIPDYKGSPIDLIFDALRFGFTGLGYYPHWRYNDKIVGGLHLDTRPLKWDKNETKNYSHSRWMGIPGKNGQRYMSLTFQNLIKHTEYFNENSNIVH